MKKETNYKKIIPQIKSVLEKEQDDIARMATISCMLQHEIPYFFWTGFYRVTNQNMLTVGPYQGTLGCLNIGFKRGVCGACATKKKTIIVPDTHAFAGHIACDARSNSEIVVPVFKNKKLIAVFDVDSVEKNSFCEIDKQYLEELVKIFSNVNT